jgi:hypothetical protein
MKKVLKIVLFTVLFIWAEQKVIDHQYVVVRVAWIADSDWQIASGSFYNKMDPKQTRPGTDGTGASLRKVDNGSVATVRKLFSRTDTIYLQVDDSVNIGKGKHLEKPLNIRTPYGDGINIVRVDDLMKGFEDPNKIGIDFIQDDVSPEIQTLGRFNVRFRLVRKVFIKQLIGFNGFFCEKKFKADALS